MADFNIYAEIIERKKEDFGINQVRIGLGLRTLGGAAMGSTLTYPEHGIDRIQEYVLQDYNDWGGKMGKAVPYNNRVLTPMLEKAAKVRERFPDMELSTSIIGPISNAVAIRPIEKVLRDTRKKSGETKRINCPCSG